MRKIVALLLTLAFFFLSSCAGKVENEQGKSNSEIPSVSFGPLTFLTFDEFHEELNAAKNNSTSADQELYAMYGIGAIDSYYLPSNLPVNANLSCISVNDRYVALNYTLETERKEDSQERTENELQSMITFEWVRNADGKALLGNRVESLSLKPLEGCKDVYYEDIALPHKPDAVLGRQFYWEQDGFAFMIYLPMSEMQQNNPEKTFAAVKVETPKK